MKIAKPLRWILGVLSVGWCLAFLLKGSVLPALFAFIVATLTIPPLDRAISNKMVGSKNHAIYDKKAFKIVVVVASLIAMIGFAASSTPTSTTPSPTTNPTASPQANINPSDTWTYDQVTYLMTLAGISYKTKVTKVDDMDKYIGFFNDNNGNIQLFGTKENITKVHLTLNKEAVDDLITGVPALVSGLVGDDSQVWVTDQLSSFMTKKGEYIKDTDTYFSEAKKTFGEIEVRLIYTESKTTSYKSFGAFIERK